MYQKLHLKIKLHDFLIIFFASLQVHIIFYPHFFFFSLYIYIFLFFFIVIITQSGHTSVKPQDLVYSATWHLFSTIPRSL